MLKKKYQKILLVLGVILISSFLINKFAPQVIKNVFHSAFSPIERAFSQSGNSVVGFISGIFEKSSLQKENETLVAENLSLKKQLIDFISLRDENEKLKDALCFSAEKGFDLLAVKVLAQNINQDFILIDQGQNNQVALNMPVITEQGALVGVVKEVGEGFAKVSLISSSEMDFDILIQSLKQDLTTTTEKYYTETVLGLAQGKGEGKLNLDMIPKENRINQDDIVITANLGGEFPRGLLVGEITSIKRNEAEPFQQADLKPYFTIGQLDNLFIIKNFAEN